MLSLSRDKILKAQKPLAKPAVLTHIRDDSVMVINSRMALRWYFLALTMIVKETIDCITKNLIVLLQITALQKTLTMTDIKAYLESFHFMILPCKVPILKEKKAFQPHHLKQFLMIAVSLP